jgi:hypothetical protein
MALPPFKRDGVKYFFQASPLPKQFTSAKHFLLLASESNGKFYNVTFGNDSFNVGKAFDNNSFVSIADRIKAATATW